MRSEDQDEHRPIRFLLRRLITAPAALAALWPLLLLVAGFVAWQQWGREHVAPEFQGVDRSRISVTEPPPHVRTDLVATVYQDTAMEGLSLLDRQATAKIASAFSMHPWVRSVTGVRKLPGGRVDVLLEYRWPVAMVQVFKPHSSDKTVFFFPVDGEGVLLPSNEFSRSDTLQYLHIEVPGAWTTSPVGSPFGDARVAAAARLAELLAPYREAAQLRAISVHGDPRQSSVPQLEVTRQDGTRFAWGSPPGMELAGETSPRLKLEALLGTEVRNVALTSD